ncbi:hypothetical protein C0992_012790, partial [Termitomyces sp. T32_za158]
SLCLKMLLGLEVYYLTPKKQEELLLQLLAAHDCTRVLSPNAAIPDNLEEGAPSHSAMAEMSAEGF